jgi:hypothetical protein
VLAEASGAGLALEILNVGDGVHALFVANPASQGKRPGSVRLFGIGFILQTENLRRDGNWLSAPGTGNSPVMGFVRF